MGSAFESAASVGPRKFEDGIVFALTPNEPRFVTASHARRREGAQKVNVAF
jgi:hypothetical protein